jgi:hypothetical protein
MPSSTSSQSAPSVTWSISSATHLRRPRARGHLAALRSAVSWALGSLDELRRLAHNGVHPYLCQPCRQHTRPLRTISLPLPPPTNSPVELRSRGCQIQQRGALPRRQAAHAAASHLIESPRRLVRHTGRFARRHSSMEVKNVFGIAPCRLTTHRPPPRSPRTPPARRS